MGGHAASGMSNELIGRPLGRRVVSRSRGLSPKSVQLRHQLAIGGLRIADGMPSGARVPLGDLRRRRRSASIATLAAMNPRDRIWGTGAGLFRGAPGVHCSVAEQICTVDFEGAV
jgi:hypothetical protein